MRILKKALILLTALTIFSLLFVACGSDDVASSQKTPEVAATTPATVATTPTPSTNSADTATTKISGTTFDPSTITVKKGGKLLIQNFSSFHNLKNGSWVNGSAQTQNESGIPAISNTASNGNTLEIGPFTTAGTFHIYCTVHTNMNLTVNVTA